MANFVAKDKYGDKIDAASPVLSEYQTNSLKPLPTFVLHFLKEQFNNIVRCIPTEEILIERM